LHLTIERDFEAMSWRAVDGIVASLRELSEATPGRLLNVVLSAGRTPTRVYQLLASVPREQLDRSRLALFQMDEYLSLDDPRQRLSHYLQRRVVEPLGLTDVHLLSSKPPGDLQAWATSIRAQEQLLDNRGGIDLVVHGIGTNGHLGFNEPGTLEMSAARVVRLAESTRAAFEGDPAPAWGATLGLSTLLKAQVSILLASGIAKASAVRAAVEGPISMECPASALRRCKSVTVTLDRAAASALTVSRPLD